MATDYNYTIDNNGAVDFGNKIIRGLQVGCSASPPPFPFLVIIMLILILILIVGENPSFSFFFSIGI